jgi:hypothetical protein
MSVISAKTKGRDARLDLLFLQDLRFGPRMTRFVGKFFISEKTVVRSVGKALNLSWKFEKRIVSNSNASVSSG